MAEASPLDIDCDIRQDQLHSSFSVADDEQQVLKFKSNKSSCSQKSDSTVPIVNGYQNDYSSLDDLCAVTSCNPYDSPNNDDNKFCRGNYVTAESCNGETKSETVSIVEKEDCLFAPENRVSSPESIIENLLTQLEDMINSPDCHSDSFVVKSLEDEQNSSGVKGSAIMQDCDTEINEFVPELPDKTVDESLMPPGDLVNKNEAVRPDSPVSSSDSDSDIEVLQESLPCTSLTLEASHDQRVVEPTSVNVVESFLDRFIKVTFGNPFQTFFALDDTVKDSIVRYIVLEAQLNANIIMDLETKGFVLPTQIFLPPSQITALLAEYPSEFQLRTLTADDKQETPQPSSRFTNFPCPKMTEVLSDIGFSMAVEYAYSDMVSRFERDKKLSSRKRKSKSDEVIEVVDEEKKTAQEKQLQRVKGSLNEVKQFNKPFRADQKDVKQCGVCKFQSDSSLVLAWHLAHPEYKSSHGGRPQWNCHICMDDFLTEDEVRAHYVTEHTSTCFLEKDIHKQHCPLCFSSFMFKYELDRHLVQQCRNDLMILRSYYGREIFRGFSLKRNLAPTEDDLLHINRLFWNLSQKQLQNVQNKMKSIVETPVASVSAPITSSMLATRNAAGKDTVLAKTVFVPAGKTAILPHMVPQKIIGNNPPVRPLTAFTVGNQLPQQLSASATQRSAPKIISTASVSVPPPLITKSTNPQTITSVRSQYVIQPALPITSLNNKMAIQPSKTITATAPKGQNLQKLQLPQQRQQQSFQFQQQQQKTQHLQRGGNQSVNQINKQFDINKYLAEQMQMTSNSSNKQMDNNNTLLPSNSNKQIDSTLLPSNSGAPVERLATKISAPKAVNAVVPNSISCEICDTYQPNLMAYLMHLQTNHDKYAGKTVKDMEGLPPLACSRCKGRFYCYEGLERHLLMLHGLVTKDLLMKAQTKTDRGRCKLCHKIFAFNLVHHMAIVHKRTLCSAEIMYSCDLCKQTFVQYSKLEEHLVQMHKSNTIDSTVAQPSPKKSNINTADSNFNSGAQLPPLKPTGLNTSIGASSSSALLSNKKLPTVTNRQSLPNGVLNAAAVKRQMLLQSTAGINRPAQKFMPPSSGLGKRPQFPLSSPPPVKKLRYNCTPCVLKFDTYQEVINHWEKSHLKPVLIKCCKFNECEKCNAQLQSNYVLPEDIDEALLDAKSMTLLTNSDSDDVIVLD